jgi:hypothetical protein
MCRCSLRPPTMTPTTTLNSERNLHAVFEEDLLLRGQTSRPFPLRQNR